MDMFLIHVFECNINFLIGNSTDNHLYMDFELNVGLLMINLEMLLILIHPSTYSQYSADKCCISNSSPNNFEFDIVFIVGYSTDNHIFMNIEFNVDLLMINLEMLLMLLIFISPSSYWCI